MKWLILILLFVSCNSPVGEIRTDPSKHKCICYAVFATASAQYMWRCDCDDAVCYTRSSGGLQCKWKTAEECK